MSEPRSVSQQRRLAVQTGGVTDADRETALQVLGYEAGVAVGEVDPADLLRLALIAQAIVDARKAERRRVREPFEKLAATFPLIAARHFEKADGEDYRAGLGDGYESAAAHLRRVLRELDGRPGTEETGQ